MDGSTIALEHDYMNELQTDTYVADQTVHNSP